MVSLYAAVIFEFSLRTLRNSPTILFLNTTATTTSRGMAAKMSPARRALMRNMNTVDETMLESAQHTSSMPHVMSPEMRPESEVTRAMIQPTGVLSKYEKERPCRWSNIFLRRSYCTRSPRTPGHEDHAEHAHAPGRA